MKRTWMLATLAAVLGAAALTQAQDVAPTLKVGDRAPALTAGDWIKGEPITAFESGKIYVVEFWATWCPPCRKSIPHLTELQKRFADKGVTIIGLDSGEQDTAAVKAYVEKMGDQMAYHVAMDDFSGGSGKMSAAWMDAAGQNGIPTAFVVDTSGNIAWIGHPMDGLDRVLDHIVAGTFDPKAEAEAAARTKKLEEGFSSAIEREDFDAALAINDELAAARPDASAQFAFVRFRLLLAKKDYTAASTAGAALVDDHFKDNARMLNEIAWDLATDPRIEQRDLSLALRAALRANELSEGKDGPILDTVARVYAEQGDLEKAIAYQRDAVARGDEEDREQLQATLDGYESKAASTPAP